VNALTYKTIRYPGHCAKIRFLMNELKLKNDKSTLKRILENALPKTYQDVVILYISIVGKKGNALEEENYVRKFYPKTLYDLKWSAIQLTTATCICAIIDIVINHSDRYHGFIKCEDFSLQSITDNQFGHYLA